MNCKNLRIRSKNYKKYGYCVKYKKEVPIFCKECEQIEYKEIKPIKKRTSKQTKAETKRYSIFTSDLDSCIICGKKRDNLHEVFFGRNRQQSMIYGLVIPLCANCHLEVHKNKQLQDVWHIKGQELFGKTYPELNFVSIFGKNYCIKKEPSE